MTYRIVHQTAYHYSEPASLSQNELFLQPRETTAQQVVESWLAIVPELQYLHRRVDFFGNTVHVFMLQQPHDALSITATSTVDTPVDRVLAERKGVCQDFAHLALSCLRSLGLSARYVSGYLQTDPPPGKPKLIGADASHAWVSLFVPGSGWVDLDPTNNVIPGESHITLAWGRDYGDVTPVKGVVMVGGVHTLSVKVDVSVVA